MTLSLKLFLTLFCTMLTGTQGQLLHEVQGQDGDDPQYYIDNIGLTNPQVSDFPPVGVVADFLSGPVGPYSRPGWSARRVKPGPQDNYEVYYEVLFTGTDNGFVVTDYDVVEVDMSGNFVRSIKAKLWEDEKKFNYDIDGDGNWQGLVVMEMLDGEATYFARNTVGGPLQYYIVDSYNTIGLTLDNDAQFGPTSNVAPAVTSDWEVIKVQKLDEDNYEVLLSNSGDYDVYQFNSEGNFVGYIKTKLWEDELKFNSDIDRDEETGSEQIFDDGGGTTLNSGKNTVGGYPQYYINNAIGLTNPQGVADFLSGPVGPLSRTGWSAIRVKIVENNYEVLFTAADNGFVVTDYDVVEVDMSGNFVRSIKAKLWEDEKKFNYDIDGDGNWQGLVVMEMLDGMQALNFGKITVGGPLQYYINNAIGLTNPPEGVADFLSGPVGPLSRTGWSAIRVKIVENNYEVLFTAADNGFVVTDYDVVEVDMSGNFVRSIKANLWEDELKFNYDIDGSFVSCGQQEKLWFDAGCACGGSDAGSPGSKAWCLSQKGIWNSKGCGAQC